VEWKTQNRNQEHTHFDFPEGDLNFGLGFWKEGQESICTRKVENWRAKLEASFAEVEKGSRDGLKWSGAEADVRKNVSKRE